MKHIDPYAPIEKQQLVTRDGMTSRGYTVRIEDEESDSGWSECGLVSEDYLLVPNRDVRDMAHEIAGRSPLRFEEDKTFFDGKRFVYGLAAKEEGLVEVRVGDPVGIGLLFENSYDGSRRLAARLYVHRLACSNGMIAPELFRQVRFRHGREAEGWEEEVQRSLAMVRQAERGLREFAEAVGLLEEIRMDASELRRMREGALPRLPVTLWGKVMDRFLLHEELGGYGLLNAATNILWHDDRPSFSNFRWNEYATGGLIQHALEEARGTRRN